MKPFNGTRILVALLLAGSVGCGSGAGGSDETGPAPVPVPVPVVLQSLSIGTDLNLTPDDVVAVAAIGNYSNDTHAAVEAAWTLSAPGIVTLSSPHGTVVTVTAQINGAIDLTATFETKTATIHITVSGVAPTGPGTVFGDSYGGMVQYASDGSNPTAVSLGFSTAGRGVVLSRDNSTAYAIGEFNGTNVLGRFDPSNPSENSIVATFNGTSAPFTDNVMGMDIDGQGRVYIYCYDGGRVLRYDPATNATTLFRTIGASLDIAIDDADNFYYGPFLASGNGPLITTYQFIPAWGINYTYTWANAPADEPGYFVASGISFNSRGEAFTMNTYGTKVYRCVDTNGDGYATDAGELTVFANLPGAYSDTFVYGIAATRGSGVLINRQVGPAQTTTNTGLFWLIDRDENGNADGADEQVLFNQTSVYNGLDAGCVTATR